MRNLYDFPDYKRARQWLGAVADERVTVCGVDVPVPHYLSQDWAFMARPGQRWVPGSEQITLWSMGRGAGKTRGAAEAVYEGAMDPERWGGHALIIGPEPRHIEDNCLRGLSGILTLAQRRPWFVPQHKPSKRLLVFPNPRGGGSGLEVRYASSEKPRQVRGPNVGFMWVDEFAHCNFSETQGGQNFWETALDTLRARGTDQPRALLTTTPLPIPDVVELWRAAVNPSCPACGGRDFPERTPLHECARTAMRRVDPRFSLKSSDPEQVCTHCQHEFNAKVRVLQANTLDNRANLADDYIKRRVLPRMATRIGRQEVEGAVLEDTPGALIPFETIQYARVAIDYRPGWEEEAKVVLGLTRAVVFVDPAMTSSTGADESGVVVVGLQGSTGRLLLLEDRTVSPEECQGAPSNTWGPRAYEAALRWNATHIVCETNQGGQLVAEQIPRAAIEVEGRQLYVADGNDADAWTGLPAWQRTSWGERGLAKPRLRPKVKDITNFRSKTERWEWASPRFETGQALLVVPRGRDVSYWQPLVDSLSRFSPTMLRGRRGKRDRGDAAIGAMRELEGVDEAKRGKVSRIEVVDLAEAWR